MSSSDPPQVRLSLSHSASTFKRSFDQFGFDLESPLDPTAVASSSGTVEHRPGPSNADRNKRARSNSVTPTSAEQTHSMDASPTSSSSHTLSSALSNHAVANHRDAPPAVPPTRHPQAPEADPFFPSSLGGQLSHPSSGLFDARPLEPSLVEPTPTSVWSNPVSSTNPSTEQNDQFRLSMERFHAFDSQISSIRSRPSPLPFRVPANPPTLPPLTLSSSIEHSHSHINPAVSLPSVDSSTSERASASASVPSSTAPSSTTFPDQYNPNMSRFEEFGEFREITSFFHGENPSSSITDRPSVGRRHQTPPLPDNSERRHIGAPFRRSFSRHPAENVSRHSAIDFWPSDRRSIVPDDSDDDIGGRPVPTSMADRASLDLPTSRFDSSLLANRLRRSMENHVTHSSLDRISPPLFLDMPPSQVEPNSTHPVNAPRTQEPGRHEPWSFHHPSRLPVFAEAVRTLARRLGRARQRTSYGSEHRAERSRSPAAGALSSSVPPGYPELTSPEDSPYDLDLLTPWFNEENPPSRLSIPTSRIPRDTSVSRQVPWRSSLLSNHTSEEPFLNYLTPLHRPSVTAPSGDATQSDPIWRRHSYTNYHSPHLPSIRTSSSRGDRNDIPSAPTPHVGEHDTHDVEAMHVGRGWSRSVPRGEQNYGPDSTPNPSAILSDHPATERRSAPIRDFNGRLPHSQPPPQIAPYDLNTRRSSEIYQSMPTPDVEGMIVDAHVFRPDESPAVPFSSHAAALFGSRATLSAPESTSQRRPDVGLDRISQYPWSNRVEEDFAFPTPRHRANAGERRHRSSPDPEHTSTIRRLVAEPPASSAPAPRMLDIEEFQHGPFRATLERLERQGRQDQQMMMERQAEIDRLRSRLDELQSQERSAPSSRAPTLPPLRFGSEYFVPEAPHRTPTSTHPANIEATSAFRADLEAAHRRRSWQRGRGTRPPWPNPGDEPAPWRSTSVFASSTNPLPIPRAHSPPRAIPESRNIHPAVEPERERRRRPGTLELWSPGEADDAMDTLGTSPVDDGSFMTRSFARTRGEFQTSDRQQPRREPRSNDPWGGFLTLREHGDALRGLDAMLDHHMDPWGTLARDETIADAPVGGRSSRVHPPGPWGTEVGDEMFAAGSSNMTTTDVPPARGRRRRANQSALPPQGRNVSEDERAPGARSRYVTARRVRDPVLDRVQRMVRGSPREGGLLGRYARRNAGDFMRDEDFDASYESLLSLAATIGEVRPRHTPDHVLNSLPTATFKEWRNTESDQRCPICLDDYQEDDPVMRLSDCSHWLHKNCLQQWLKGATTCPVCRQRVRCSQAARRDHGARADPQPVPSLGSGDRRGIDLARQIREHVRMAFPDLATPVSRSDAGPGGSGSEVEREIIEPDGDVVDMWELIGG